MAGVAKLQLLIDLRNNLRRGLDTARRQVTRAVGGMQDRLNAFGVRNSQIFESIQAQVPALSGALGSLANPYMAVGAVIAAVGAAIVKCTMAANDWHVQMAEINVTAELSKKMLGKLSDKLLEIGGRNVAELEEVPKAFSKIISAGLSVKQSLDTLEPTLRAAKAGFSEIETVASAGTAVMMSTGYEATRVYDILFETVKEGNAEFKDISQYLPKVIPLAKNVGYELEQTAGAFAMLTGRLSVEKSATSLEGIMRALSSQKIAIGQVDKATGKYVSGFKSIGIDVFDPMTKKIKPILDIVKELDSQMKGLSDKDRMIKFDKLGLDQMGTLGISSLMQDIPALEKAINATTNSAGSMEKAYTDSLTPLESWKIIQNQIKVEMIHIGELFLPILSQVGEKVLGIIQYWKDLYRSSEMFRDLISGLGLVFEVLFKITYGGIILIVNISKSLFWIISSVVTKLGEWLGKITGLKTGFKDLYSSVKPYLLWLKDMLVEIGGLLYDVFTLNFEGAFDRISNFKMPDIKEIRNRIQIESSKDDSGDFSGVPTAITGDTGSTTGTGSTTIADDMKGIKGGTQTKNITINIDSFIKGFSPTHQTFNGLSVDEFERKMTEMFMRVIRGAETAS